MTAKKATPNSPSASVVERNNSLAPGAVGLTGVLFLTITGAAPESAMLGNVPFAAGQLGIHVPAAFLLATLVLLIFCVGYAAMAGQISAAGGFYSFIARGLGRVPGLAAGFASLVCYSLFEAALYGLFAYFGADFLLQYFGLQMNWVTLALAALIVAGILSYFDVKLSAAVLGTALVLEVLVLLIFAAGVFSAASGTNLTLEAFNIFRLADAVPAQTVGQVAIPAGSAAVGIFMAFWSWVGFEMAPNYAEESRDPKRSIPRSLYFSVIGLGLFYMLISWCAVSAWPSESAMLAATQTPLQFFLTPINQFVGTWAQVVMNIFILTSSFACGMAFHNTAARYLYSLAREGLVPGMMGRTHRRWRSPHVASSVMSVVAACWILVFAFTNGTNDPYSQAYLGVYTLFAVLGTGLVLILQAVVSLAIIAWFRKNGGGSVLTVVVAPALSFIVQAVLVYLLVENLSTLAGASPFARAIPWIMLAVVALGILWALVIRSIRPQAYRNIGHMGG